MFDCSSDPLARAFIPFLERSFRHFQVAGDYHEQIVEVVCDAAGQLSNGFQLLRVAKQGFGLLTLPCFGLKH
jgi:hypothetical protein